MNYFTKHGNAILMLCIHKEPICICLTSFFFFCFQVSQQIVIFHKICSQNVSGLFYFKTADMNMGLDPSTF